MTLRNAHIRLAKLEAKAPPPPSPFDGMTCDELTVCLIEIHSDALKASNLTAEERAEQKAALDRLVWRITATVNLASGRWMKPPGFDNYQERIVSAKTYWERLQPERGEYVSALNHDIEHDGFPLPGRGAPAAPGLMKRRAALWQHPIVKQIAAAAPMARIEDSLLKECGSYMAGQPGKPSDTCGQMCKRECINARRGGFKSVYSLPAGRVH